VSYIVTDRRGDRTVISSFSRTPAQAEKAEVGGLSEEERSCAPKTNRFLKSRMGLSRSTIISASANLRRNGLMSMLR